MLPRTMSQGPDASKDADSVAKADASQNEAPAASSVQPLPSSDTASDSSSPAAVEGAPVKTAACADDATNDEAAFKQAESQGTGSDKKPLPARAQRRSRRDEDEDDEDDLPIPETEEALNIPKPQTLGMLGAMSTLTLVAWFAARLACNAHPDQVREPKHFSTKDLAADPKNAAFEFHHSFETHDFTTALDLAMGEVKKLVTSKLAECESAPDACEEQQKALAGSVNSVARVLEQNPERAIVELVSHFSKSLEPKTFQFTVEKQGDFWRVSARREVANSRPVETSAAPSGAANAPALIEEAPASQAAPASPAQ